MSESLFAETIPFSSGPPTWAETGATNPARRAELLLSPRCFWSEGHDVPAVRARGHASRRRAKDLRHPRLYGADATSACLTGFRPRRPPTTVLTFRPRRVSA